MKNKLLDTMFFTYTYIHPHALLILISVTCIAAITKGHQTFQNKTKGNQKSFLFSKQN